MNFRRFERATVRPYTFREDHGDREIVALYIGGKRAGLIDYNAARRLAERLAELCDNHEFTERLFLE